MRIELPTLLFAVAISVDTHAQLILSEADNAPLIGNTFTYERAAYIAPPAGGADLLFDYSSLTSTGTVQLTWIDPSLYSNADANPTAEIALADGPDTMLFATTSAGLELVGERNELTILGTNFVLDIQHTDNLLDLKLPLSFGEAWSDVIAGSVTADGSTGTRNGTFSAVADGYGSIVLPGGSTAPVLRVRKQLTEIVQIPINDVLSDVVHKRLQVDYYAPWLKMPILSSYVDSLTYILNIVETGTRYMLADPVGVSSASLDNSVVVYPNPANDMVSIGFLERMPAGTRITLLDRTGRIVEDRTFANIPLRHDMPLADHPDGLYVVNITTPSGRVSTHRFVKH